VSGGEQRMLLQGISWETYQRLVVELEDSPSTRLAYAGHSLELMKTSYAHERIKVVLGGAINFYTVEAQVPLRSGGSTTLARADLARGVDPELCYWVQNEASARAGADVPPDLVIEVELTKSSLDRLAIFAALGVREVWRHDGQALSVLLLGAHGRHEAAARSAAFPDLPPAELARVVELRGTTDDMTLMRDFQRRARDGFPGSERS
jgi:Uma2 family endonuclease